MSWRKRHDICGSTRNEAQRLAPHWHFPSLQSLEVCRLGWDSNHSGDNKTIYTNLYNVPFARIEVAPCSWNHCLIFSHGFYVVSPVVLFRSKTYTQAWSSQVSDWHHAQTCQLFLCHMDNGHGPCDGVINPFPGYQYCPEKNNTQNTIAYATQIRLLRSFN